MTLLFFKSKDSTHLYKHKYENPYLKNIGIGQFNLLLVSSTNNLIHILLCIQSWTWEF